MQTKEKNITSLETLLGRIKSGYFKRKDRTWPKLQNTIVLGRGDVCSSEKRWEIVKRRMPMGKEKEEDNIIYGVNA